MNQLGRDIARKLAELILDEEENERAEQIMEEFLKHDVGFGYDIFGAEPESALLVYCLVKYLYDHYFRVDSYGIENIPAEGGAVLAANHSGIVPVDGAMVTIDVLRKTEPPRILRAVIENMFAKIPFSIILMSRIGQVVGVRRNFDELLKMEQMVIVFPEGARGMGKVFTKRYQLTRFNVGHVELAIQNKVPLIPIAVIGGEEQAPIIYNWEWFGRLLGLNAFPLTLTWPWLGPIGLTPLPTKYYIYYGEPFYFHEEDPEALTKMEVIREMADRVQDSVQNMINEGLKKRPSVFFRN